MNQILTAICLVGAFSTHAFAAQAVRTLVTCQQYEGADWVEFGIADDSGGYRAYVVSHDSNGHSQLRANSMVDKRVENDLTIYENAQQTLQTTVSSDLKGSVTLVSKGPNGIRESGLGCILDSQIAWE